MDHEKAVKFFSNMLTVTFFLSAFVGAAHAQVQLTGQGGSELMMYLARITNFAFYISIVGCLGSLMFAGYKFSTGHQQGMEQVKMAIIGTAIVAASSGVLKYWIFAAQDTGMTNNGSAPF